VFHSTEPAWNDDNVRELTRAIESPLFFSHVRAAAGPPIQRTNCHPFRWENWLFMHNGFLADFAKVKRDLTFAIDPSLYTHVQGTTDSEVLFHLAITNGLTDDPVAALRATVDLVERVGRDHGIMFPMQGTVAVADGATIWTLRYSTQGRSRTLFHSVDIPTIREMYPDAERLGRFGDHAHVVVSEPLNDLPGVFVEVPESTIAVLDREGYHHEPFRTAA
jgi:glutamine amidotransferase